MNYGHWTDYNLLPTDADGSISPDILSMVHKAKDNFICSKQPLPKLHILRFQKGNAITQYTAYTAVLCSSDQTGHLFLVPRAALCKMATQNYIMGS